MKKRDRMKFPKPMSDLIDDTLAGMGIGERLKEARIWNLWVDVVGTAIARQAQPVRIINGTLTVAVSSGPWMQELTFLKDMMREKLNRQLGAELVREIVLKSGRIKPEQPDAEEQAPVRRKLTQRQLSSISECAAEIADAETRAAFEALMKTSLEHVRSSK